MIVMMIIVNDQRCMKEEFRLFGSTSMFSCTFYFKFYNVKLGSNLISKYSGS